MEKSYAHPRSEKSLYNSTMDFFRVTSDDMILFWGDDENIRFSQELKNWFDALRRRFDMFMESGDIVENPLYWILELMEYADENYYRIYTFSEFFSEIMEHLNDRCFWHCGKFMMKWYMIPRWKRREV